MTRRQKSYSPTARLVSNAIHPEHASTITQNTQQSSADLFLARVSKTKKSFYINVTVERVIHVQQYVQKSEHLLDEETLQPTTNNNDTTIVLFLIHGVGGSSEMWDKQIEYFLQEGYEIVSLDLLGHGLSSKPNDSKAYLFQELANDVLHVFDIFCKRRNVLIGHSYGSSFCTLLSKERSSYVSKVVMISGGGPSSLMPDRCSAFCLPLPMFFVLRPTLVKMFRRMAFHVDTNKRVRRKITTFGISAYALKAIMQGQQWPEADEQYHADLIVPVLLIYGKGDQFVSLEDELWMNETIYGSELEIIDNAGHMVMIESPTIVNHVLHRFLNRDSSTKLGSLPEYESSKDKQNDNNVDVDNNPINRRDSANSIVMERRGSDKAALELTNLDDVQTRNNDVEIEDVEKTTYYKKSVEKVTSSDLSPSKYRVSFMESRRCSTRIQSDVDLPCRTTSRMSQISRRSSSRLKRKIML